MVIRYLSNVGTCRSERHETKINNNTYKNKHNHSLIYTSRLPSHFNITQILQHRLQHGYDEFVIPRIVGYSDTHLLVTLHNIVRDRL